MDAEAFAAYVLNNSLRYDIKYLEPGSGIGLD
jgi:hypothetical protein